MSGTEVRLASGALDAPHGLLAPAVLTHRAPTEMRTLPEATVACPPASAPARTEQPQGRDHPYLPTATSQIPAASHRLVAVVINCLFAQEDHPRLLAHGYFFQSLGHTQRLQLEVSLHVNGSVSAHCKRRPERVLHDSRSCEGWGANSMEGASPAGLEISQRSMSMHTIARIQYSSPRHRVTDTRAGRPGHHHRDAMHLGDLSCTWHAFGPSDTATTSFAIVFSLSLNASLQRYAC